VQRCAGANKKAERVKRRDNDRCHESRLSKNVGNLDRHNTDEVHGRDRAETALPGFRKKIKDKYVRPSKCVSVPVSTSDGRGTYPPID